MRVVWTTPARDHLREAADYVAQDSPAAALRLVDDLPERVNALLAANPMIGRRGRIAGTRELVVAGTPYVVAYRVARDRVDVLALIHGARRWPEKF